MTNNKYGKPGKYGAAIDLIKMLTENGMNQAANRVIVPDAGFNKQNGGM